MAYGLHCIAVDCEDEASGLIIVNMTDPEITVMMIPSCQDHADKMRTHNWSITRMINAEPFVEIKEDELQTQASVYAAQLELFSMQFDLF